MAPQTAFGGYDDWPAFMAAGRRLAGPVASLLGVVEPRPGPVTRHEEHVRDGVRATRLTWPLGFGPDASAWLLHPADSDPAALPGVLALHSHGGIKSVGAERMVDVPGVPDHVLAYRASAEGGRAFASDLARAGCTVLAPDAFGWGARRFDLGREDAREYDDLAGPHEHLVAKACALFDTSLAGMVAHDDLAALGVLRGVCAPGPVGLVGFSGGGGRVAALTSLDAGIGAAVIVAMMTTSASLFPDHVGHSWLLHTRGLATGPDLPGLAAADGSHHLMVAYCADDHLFAPAGMRAADDLLQAAFEGGPGSYTGVWSETGHVFTLALQTRAIDHLTHHLHRSNHH